MEATLRTPLQRPLRKSACAMVAGTIIAAVMVAHAAFADPLSAERRSDLDHLLRQDCGSCHGMVLKGGLGPPLLPENVAKWDVDSLAAMILVGNPKKAMPSWSELLSDADARYLAERLLEGSVR